MSLPRRYKTPRYQKRLLKNAYTNMSTTENSTLIRPSTPQPKRLFDLEVTTLQMNSSKLQTSTFIISPTTPSVNKNAVNELLDIFNSSPTSFTTSPKFPPLPERNIRNRRPSFLLVSVDLTKFADITSLSQDCHNLQI
jgi:hypothetical protein